MTRFAPILAASFLALPLVPATGATAATPMAMPSAASLAHLELDLQALPVALHRRAADTLELEREREGSPWADATLSAAVLPLYEPGEPEPTHYELGVQGPGGDARGFMVLASGKHDYPVVLSTSQGPRRTAELAATVSSGETVSRLYFLSSVSMVAESADGRMLGTLGGLPPRVEHAQMEWLDAPAATRLGHTHYDAATETTTSIAPEHEIELGTWPSWKALRAGYQDNLAVLHEARRRAAADDWAAEEDFLASGEGLQSGWFREVPLLARGGARIEVDGDGAPFVHTRIDERPFEGDSAVLVFVDDIPDAEVREVNVTVHYGDGSSEIHRFDVARTITLPSRNAELGALGAGLLPVTALAAPSATAAPECRKAVLHSSWDTYVFARDGGGSTLESKGGWVGGWEVFTLHRAGRDHVQLQTRNGDWVYAPGGGGGTVRADGLNGGGDALLKRIAYPDGTVAFQTRNGRNYLQANNVGMVNATPTASRSWEKFELGYCEPERLEGRWAGNDPIDAYRKVRKYDQVPGKFGPNTSDCSSGCGATAWGMVFGWADNMAALGDSRWAGAANLYRAGAKKDGAPATAPEWMWNDVPGRMRTQGGTGQLLAGPAAMIIELRNLMSDWGASGCSAGDSRFTVPHIMGQATKYLPGRVTTNLTADYDGASVMTHEGKTKAKRRLEDKQVVAIGIGHFSHYPLAFGFEDARFAKWDADARRWESVSRHQRFVVHMGWGHPGSSNVPYDTWFQGWIDPPKTVTGSNVANDSTTVPAKPLPRAKGPLTPLPKLPGPAPTPRFPK